MRSPALLSLATTAAVLSTGAAALQASASGDGGNPVAVGDSWTVRFEFDLGSMSNCFQTAPNFVEATRGCFTDDGPIADCTVQTGRTSNSTEDVDLVYFGSECAMDASSAVEEPFANTHSFLRLDFFEDDACATVDRTHVYVVGEDPSHACHVSAKQEPSGAWLGRSHQASLDYNGTGFRARVREFNSTDCSGEPVRDLSADDATLRTNTCVGRVQFSSNLVDLQYGGGSNGASGLHGLALAVVAAAASSLAMAVY